MPDQKFTSDELGRLSDDELRTLARLLCIVGHGARTLTVGELAVTIGNERRERAKTARDQ
jgi:hypothetical protein